MRPWPVLLLLLAGCASPAPVALGDDAFILYHWQCGFAPAEWICEYTFIQPDGTLVSFQGEATSGEGRVTFEGAHPGLDAAHARAWLQKAGIWTTAKDYRLRDAFAGTATPPEMLELRTAAAGFETTKAPYNNEPGLADGGTLQITVTTESWTHTSSAYVGKGDPAYDEVRDAVEAVRDAAALRAGASSG